MKIGSPTQLLRALSLLAALVLLGGAVLDAQTGLVREVVLSATPDAGKGRATRNFGRSNSYMHGSKSLGGFDLSSELTADAGVERAGDGGQ